MKVETASILGAVSPDGLKFDADNKDAFRGIFKPFFGMRVWLTVEQYREPHTQAQRAFWFGVVVRCFMDAMGESDSYYVHREVLKLIGHCVEKVNKLTGEISREPMRTRRSSKEAYSERIMLAQIKGAEIGVIIPDANSERAQSMITDWKRSRREGEAG